MPTWNSNDSTLPVFGPDLATITTGSLSLATLLRAVLLVEKQATEQLRSISTLHFTLALNSDAVRWDTSRCYAAAVIINLVGLPLARTA